MKFYTLNVYVFSFLLRALWSLIICVVAATGMGIATTNNLKHNYFEFFFFLIVLLAELIMAGVYIWLYRKQRGLRDLEEISRKDGLTSCAAIFFRIVWHIALSVFVLVRIELEGLILKNRKWRDIRDMTIVVMAFALIHILGFVWSLLNQPLEFIRSEMPIPLPEVAKGTGNVVSNQIIAEEEGEDDESPQKSNRDDVMEKQSHSISISSSSKRKAKEPVITMNSEGDPTEGRGQEQHGEYSRASSNAKNFKF